MDETSPLGSSPPQEICPEIIEGRHIEAFLAFKGWKQGTLGEALGVTQGTISKWMRGEQEPSARANLQLRRLFTAEGFFADNTSPHVRSIEARVVDSPVSNRAASMTEIGPGQYRLRIDKIVPRAVALQIMSLLPDK